MMRTVLKSVVNASKLCAVAAGVYGLGVNYSNSRKTFVDPQLSEGIRIPSLSMLHSWNQARVAHCDTFGPCLCVVTEIPQGSSIYLTGHGDQAINQAESGAEPFIFKFTRGHIPQTLGPDDEPLYAVVLGHLESVPGWMLKDVPVVGMLVVLQKDTGVVLSRDLVAVIKEHNLTREQIEDLMTDAAQALEHLKSDFELGTQVFVKPVYDHTAAAQMLRDAKVAYQQKHEMQTEKKEAHKDQSHSLETDSKQIIHDTPLSDVPLATLFEELAKRGMTVQPGESSSNHTADAK